jgi:hypothetical protein
MLQTLLQPLREKSLSSKLKQITVLLTVVALLTIVILFNKPSMPEQQKTKRMFANKHNEVFSQPKTFHLAGRDQIYRKNKTVIDSITYNWFHGKASDGSYIDAKNDSIHLKHVADNSSKILARKSDIHDVNSFLIISG